MALLWKMICNLGDPTSLRHPVQGSRGDYIQHFHRYNTMQHNAPQCNMLHTHAHTNTHTPIPIHTNHTQAAHINYRELAEKMFNIFDQDNSGVVRQDEILQQMKKMGIFFFQKTFFFLKNICFSSDMNKFTHIHTHTDTFIHVAVVLRYVWVNSLSTPE